MSKVIIPLSHVKTRMSAMVVSLQTGTGGERSKLMALGLMPGEAVQVLQRFPSIVVRIGNTQVAMDRETAALIQVEPHTVT